MSKGFPFSHMVRIPMNFPGHTHTPGLHRTGQKDEKLDLQYVVGGEEVRKWTRNKDEVI